MTAQCSDCRTDRDIETAAAIAELRAEVRGLRSDIRESVVTQVKDHGKRLLSVEQSHVTKADHAKHGERIGAIEGRERYRAGWMAGAGVVGGAAGAALLKAVAIFFR